MSSYRVPFGNSEIVFDLPWTTVDIAQRNTIFPAIADVEQQLTAFAESIVANAKRDTEIIIAFTDATRHSPDQQLAEPMLGVFQSAGVRVGLICAVGMHRPSTEEEKRVKLGDWIVDNFEIIDHEASAAIPMFKINDIVVESNRFLRDRTLISLGVVEPHQYAGYSGGYKTIVIGCGGAQTISVTHGPQFLKMPGTRLANMDNNPFQAFVRQAGIFLGHDYAVNVILNEQGEIVHLRAGEPGVVHDDLIALGRSYFEVPVPRNQYDVVIAGVGAPKDANLYQASRGATYIGLSAAPVLRDGGVIILPAQLSEGAGEGRGEQNMLDVLQQFGPTQALLDHLLANGCRAGEQRAFMIAQLLQRYRLIIVGSEAAGIVESVGLEHAVTMAAAVEMVALENPHALIVPDAIKMLPVATSST